MDGLGPGLLLRGAPPEGLRHHEGQEPRDGRRREEKVRHETTSGLLTTLPSFYGNYFIFSPNVSQKDQANI